MKRREFLETVGGATLACISGDVVGASEQGKPAAIAPAHRAAALPPLMQFLDGTPVRTRDDWTRRKAEIRRLLSETFCGTFPEEVPPIIKAEVVQEQEKEDGSTRRRVKLTFDTRNKASFEMWVWIPRGQGPFPVLLTQPRYYQLAWAELALSRGYLVGLYPGVCYTHREGDYPGYETVYRTFQQEYPEATWSSIATKAWLAGRALDYLLASKYGYPVANGQVGIIGFSRYGKQSMLAAAFDERITSVVARSPGTPASCPHRFAGRHYFMEAGYVDAPKEWWVPKLGTYYGREHEMPIDGHGWYALIAPRRCLIHTAHNDGAEVTFAVERAYLEGSKVYSFLGKPENLRILYRTGQHNPITDEQRRQNIDWLDLSFGRGTARQSDFPEQFIHKFDWQAWKAKLSPEQRTVPFPAPQARDNPDRKARIRWALGQAPQKIPWDGTYTFLTEAESAMMTHDRWRVGGTARVPVSFGANVRGNIYYNTGVKAPAPVVIWLHPYSYHSGYNEGYGVQGTTVYHRLAQEGFVVLAYDQCGFGLRLLEGRDFYKEYPKWSKLGRMVHDVRAAVDFLADGHGAANGDMPAVDKDHVYVLGYSLGGSVGLHTTAIDDRIAGVASFCGFTPMRTDTDKKSTGGIRRFWEWHSLQPLLGLFHGREQQIPYDFDDVLALIAPRPCLVYSPKRDREADYEDVAACVERARQAWKANGRGDNFTHQAPDDINRFQADQQNAFLRWTRGLC
ncbi:MAG: alpha/beta fold hydrolase [Planctomycetes bacterium]|nr:alpha/beta fold hydrolase [Planctomycetota bacterium]